MKKGLVIGLCIAILPWASTFSGGVYDEIFPDDMSGDFLLYSTQKRVSLDLEDARLVDVLKMFSQQSGLNFVSTEAVRDRTLTLYLEKVPLKEALDILFQANHLTYSYFPEANVFVVKEMGKPTVELKTKVYRLQYARVQSSRLQKEISETIAGEKEEEGGGRGRGLKEAVGRVLTEFGKVTEDPLTNSLIVVDVPSQFSLIDEVIQELDVPTPLVMIEVEMLDVSKNSIDKLGIKWPQTLASILPTGTREIRGPFGDQGTDIDSRSIDPEKGAFGGDDAIYDLDAWPANKFGPSIVTILGTEITLDFLRDHTDAKSLARPKILTLSNETAEIKITTDEAIGIRRVDTEEGGTEFEIERAETGTRLRVTPQVKEMTGEITLFVETVVREAKPSGFSALGDSSLITGQIKDPEERSATAIARLQEGETLLLGGLIKSDVSDQQVKIPLLGDIPLFGRAFRYRDKNVEERELLVFLTPYLVEERPLLGKQEKMIYREQGDALKRDAVRIALDTFSY